MFAAILTNIALAILAVAVHELGHMLTAAGCGMEVKGLTFNWRHGVATRIRMSKDPVQNALTYFGGPLLNILAATFVPLGATWILLNLVAAFGNLLPLPHSDGSQLVLWLRRARVYAPREG